MIVLKNIARNSTRITCDAYVEDCKQAVSLVFDEKLKELEAYSLPDGYEWCVDHIMHARKWLSSLDGKPIEKSTRTIMWY